MRTLMRVRDTLELWLMPVTVEGMHLRLGIQSFSGYIRIELP